MSNIIYPKSKVYTDQNVTGSGKINDPVILKDQISVEALTASYLLNGLNVTASGDFSHAEGEKTLAQGNYSHAEGWYTTASGYWSHAEGEFTLANGAGSHAEGGEVTASGPLSHAEGYQTKTSDNAEYSHAEGWNTVASGNYSHAEGLETKTIGFYSHAEGEKTVTNAGGSHAEGYGSIVAQIAYYSHAEGYESKTSGSYSHAEGGGTEAIGNYSHAEGQYSIAHGEGSHAEGFETFASGGASHAEGYGTTASADFQHVQGKWNVTSSTALAIIGNGTADNNRSNILEIYTNKLVVSGGVQTTSDLTASNLLINGTASINVLNTVEQTSLKIGDKYITIMTGANTQAQLNGSGILFGSASVGESGEQGSVAHIIYKDAGDQVEIYPNLKVSGSAHIVGNLTASSLRTDYIDFDTTKYDLTAPTTPGHVAGRIFFDSGSGDLVAGLNHTNLYLKNGQQLVQRVKNAESSSILKGKVVHITGSDQSNAAVPRIRLADWSNDGMSANTIGVAMTDMSASAEGFIIIAGMLDGLNTNAYSGGDILYLSSSGGFTNIKPTAPKHTVSIGQVIRTNTNVGSIYVKIQNGYELDELHDVSASLGKQNGDLLVWDSTNSVWKNSKILSGSYNIYGSLLNGEEITVTGLYAHAEGGRTLASGDYSHAEGIETLASGEASHAEGRWYNDGSNNHYVTASGLASHAEGGGTLASGDYSHAEGIITQATNSGSHAEGNNTQAYGAGSHAEGVITTASGSYSHSEGFSTIAYGYCSHAEGSVTKASGSYSHAEGFSTIAYNTASHAEGYQSLASGNYSHAEGYQTTASGPYSHAEGNFCRATNTGSHAGGELTLASGKYSCANGYNTHASGNYSFAIGDNTIANGNYQFVAGGYNSPIQTALVIVGNGTILNKTNIIEIYNDRMVLSGNLVFPNGNGIDFGATSGSNTTSTLLDDYEEGTWTLNASFSITSSSGRYTKIGNMVYIIGNFTANATIDGANDTISGLPYSVASDSPVVFSVANTTIQSINNGWIDSVPLGTDLIRCPSMSSGSVITFSSFYRVGI